jgi:hypothetical protein
MRFVHLAIAALVLSACGDDETLEEGGLGDTGADDVGVDTVGSDADTADSGGDSEGSDELPATAAIFDEHRALFDAAKAHLDAEGYFADGVWSDQYGDAPMYGPSFDLAWWAQTGDEASLARARATLDANLEVVREANRNRLSILDDSETIAMSLLSLIESGQYIDVPEYKEAADTLLGVLDTLSQGLSDYLAVDAGEFASSTYGPTALTSFIALMHFEHAIAWPEDDGAAYVTRGIEVLDNVRAVAWDEELGAYRFALDDERLEIYPNITMMLATGRALLLTGDPRFAVHIEEIYQGIQPLKDEDGRHYHSPYSAEFMGATDPDYSTLSSQNYLMLAFLTAWQATGETKYIEEIDAVLGWITEYIAVEDGRVLHHWMNNRIAIPTDPEYFCTGCNLQMLFVMSLLRRPPVIPEIEGIGVAE